MEEIKCSLCEKKAEKAVPAEYGVLLHLCNDHAKQYKIKSRWGDGDKK